MGQLQFGSLKVLDEKGTDYLCQCNICGQRGVYNKYALKNGTIKNCRMCKKFKGIELGKINEANLEVKGYRNNQQDTEKIDVLVKCKVCGHLEHLTREDFIRNKACRMCKKFEKDSVNPKIKTNIGNGTKIVSQGKNMSSQKVRIGEDLNKILPKSYSEHMKLLEKREEEILADRGILKKDHTGEVYNGLIITAQTVSGKSYKCKVKCTYCDAEYTADLSKVISYRFKCNNCKDVRHTFQCTQCKKISVRTTTKIGGAYSDDRAILSITRDDLYSGGNIQCPKCNNVINLATQAYDKDMSERRLAIISNVDNEKFGDFEKIDASTNLIISKEPVYRGRDREFRYNCYCMEHKKQLCLTATQTIGYDHSLCNDNEHMRSVPLK